MKRYLVVILTVLGLAGCRESFSPDLRVDAKAQDSVRTVNQTVQDTGGNPTIVTGVPAIAADDAETTEGEPKDKPGAVAVKMEY